MGELLPMGQLQDGTEKLTVLDQQFSTGGDLAPCLGHIWQCLGTFLVVTSSSTGIKWAKIRETAKHPTMHRTAPTTETYLNVNMPRSRNPSFRSCYFEIADMGI